MMDVPSERIATVAPVEEVHASPRVAAIFEDIKRTKQIDFVPNFWRVLATSPDQLELIWTRLKALMHPEAAGRTSPLDAVTSALGSPPFTAGGALAGLPPTTVASPSAETRMTVEVRVNGRGPYHFVVDSGAASGYTRGHTG